MALAAAMACGTGATIAAPRRAAAPAAAVRPAPAAPRQAPAPAWILPPPVASAAPMPPGAPLRFIYSDQQTRVTAAGTERYQALRTKILAPEGLAVGNIVLGWSPAHQDVIVHRLAIVRGDQVIDVLATQKFTMLQRENNLEQSMLNGDLTATLQTAGLEVGDELEFATTTIDRSASVGLRPEEFAQMPLMGLRGAFRFRVLEPKGSAIAHRVTGDVPPVTTRDLGAETERVYLMSDPASVTLPDGAPPRYSITRLMQFSGYPDWATVATTFEPFFARAAVLAPDSRIRAEAARIAAASSDPARRAEAALQLVEDRIRYVYIGLNGGNYQPATADETWTRRFGDCKAKTVLLIALLRELGIAAEPVLVASAGGDGIDERLPTPTVFDHVVVRATIGGVPVWLDGTRLGDRRLATLMPPPSRWVLPLRAGARLERNEPVPLRAPNRIMAVSIDASAGFDRPGKYKAQATLRGDEIFAMRAQLAGLAPADANKLLASYWRNELPAVETPVATWRFDDANRLLVMTMEGEGKVDWDVTDGRHTHYFYGGGFSPPSELKRPKDQPQDAAWATDFPAFTCYATTVTVPPAAKGNYWAFRSRAMDRRLAGASYWRIVAFDGKVARLVKSYRTYLSELSATEALALNNDIPGFDNAMAYVEEVKGTKPKDRAADPMAVPVFGSFEDLAGPNPPCLGQAGTAPAAVAETAQQ
jgi:hypothetical protein